jgi:hypothetical protein
MTVVNIPDDLPGWNYESTLHHSLAEVLQNSDCSWIQTIIDLGFAMACMLAAEGDAETRAVVMKILCAQLQHVVDTGTFPGETMQ